MHNRAPHTYVKSLYLLCVPRGDVFMEALMKNPFTKKFKSTIKGAVHNHRNTPVVMHHNAKYGGKFPIWVIIDFFSLGNLSYFYADWDIVDKKAFAKKLFGATYPFLDSWMKCITVLRNRCAHYSRLWKIMWQSTFMFAIILT